MGNPKSTGSVVQQVAQLTEPITRDLGLMLWDIRFLKEGAGWILRVIIDREEEPVSINDCVAVSRRLSPLLDEADPIEQSYCLEVTSPGAERELTRQEHFDYYCGFPVTVKCYQPDQNGQREFAGILQETDEDNLTLLLDEDTPLTLSRKAIATVHAIDDFEDSGEEL